jgi:hypothetical protein
MSTTTFKPNNQFQEQVSETIRFTEQTLCEDCHNQNCMSCSICGDNSQDGPSEICICSDCLEDSDGIVGTYRDIWDISKR